MEIRRRTLFERALFLATLIRTSTPSHLYLFSSQARLRDSVIIYGIKRGSKSYFFRFNKSDWHFEGDDFLYSTAQALVERLDYQFAAIEGGLRSFRPIEGSLHPDPLPKYTKVLILKRGRYYHTAGIVVNNTAPKLKVQTSEGDVILVSQDLLELLDPEDILPFGVPICDFPSSN